MFKDFIVGKVEIDGVFNVDIGVGVSDGSSVVGNDVGDLVGGDLFSFDLAQFILRKKNKKKLIYDSLFSVSLFIYLIFSIYRKFAIGEIKSFYSNL